MKTWIVVAQRDGARVYEWTARSEPLRLLEDIAHPEGRLKDGEIDADHPGAKFDAISGRSAANKQEMPTEHLAAAFAKQIAHLIDQGRVAHRFDRLVLVSGPRFMGLLRDGLNHSTRELIKHEITKNLGHSSAEDLKRHVEAELFV